MTDGNSFGDSIEGAKAVSVKSGHGSQVLLVLVGVDGSNNDAAHSRGYRTKYQFSVVADAGMEECYTDVHEMSRDHVAVDAGDAIYELSSKLQTGRIGLEDLVDGHTYTPEEIESM